nr:MAG TPA: hypothetical protein [Caudoviricetes sp.]
MTTIKSQKDGKVLIFRMSKREANGKIRHSSTPIPMWVDAER